MTGLRARRLALIASAAIAAGACSHTVTVGRSGVLQIALTEYRVVPQSIRVSAGLVTIVVHNEGLLAHNLAVTEGSYLVGQTKPILPGRIGYLPIDLSPGRYMIASTLFSDQALGEYGTLTVTS
jgi:hypothetical protein